MPLCTNLPCVSPTVGPARGTLHKTGNEEEKYPRQRHLKTLRHISRNDGLPKGAKNFRKFGAKLS